MDKMILQLPAIFTGIQTKIDGIKFTLETQGYPKPEVTSQLLSLHHQQVAGWFTFNVHQIQPEDIMNLPKLPRREGKTESERLRAVLFVYYQQDKCGFDDFDSFYKSMMERFIDHIKTKLS